MGESSESDDVGTYNVTFHLEADKRGDIHLNVGEVAKLVYGRLGAPPGSLVEYDDNLYGKLTITLKNSFQLSTINYKHGLSIRPGLRTKPLYEPNPAKKVHIFWAPKSITNLAIEAVLSKFGVIEEGVAHKVYTPKEDDDEVTKMMEGVILPDRDCKMIVKAGARYI